VFKQREHYTNTILHFQIRIDLSSQVKDISVFKDSYLTI
jgi:hypothetical protein